MTIWTTPEREDLRKTVRAFAEREVLPHVDEWERGVNPAEICPRIGPPISQALLARGARWLMLRSRVEPRVAGGGIVGQGAISHHFPFAQQVRGYRALRQRNAKLSGGAYAS